MPYALGIDFGTSYTAATVGRDGRVEPVQLGSASAMVPSVVFVREDGVFLTGEAAERRASTEPARAARECKRRIGDPTPMLVADTPFSPQQLIAVQLRAVVDTVTVRQGEPPARVALTVPASWTSFRTRALLEAAAQAGLEGVEMITEPEAAAIHYASRSPIEPGQTVAVYDLGGGTFDVSILRRTQHRFELIGLPEGIERLGGIDFDRALFRYVSASLEREGITFDSDAATRAALLRLLDDCRAAKEALSSDSEAVIPVFLPGRNEEVRITRGEFEDLIRPYLEQTIDATSRAVRSAGLEPSDLDRVLLVGGSSQIPLVADLVARATNRPVTVDASPKLSVALGAGLLAQASLPPTTAWPAPAAAPAGVGETPTEDDRSWREAAAAAAVSAAVTSSTVAVTAAGETGAPVVAAATAGLPPAGLPNAAPLPPTGPPPAPTAPIVPTAPASPPAGLTGVQEISPPTPVSHAAKGVRVTRRVARIARSGRVLLGAGLGSAVGLAAAAAVTIDNRHHRAETPAVVELAETTLPAPADDVTVDPGASPDSSVETTLGEPTTSVPTDSSTGTETSASTTAPTDSTIASAAPATSIPTSTTPSGPDPALTVYATTVCGVVNTWNTEVASATANMSGLADVSDFDSWRAVMTDVLTRLEQAARQAALGVRSAGTPAVPNGAAFVADLAGGFDAIVSNYAQTSASLAGAEGSDSPEVDETLADASNWDALITVLSNGMFDQAYPELAAVFLTVPSCQPLVQ